jgi:hypothetical protein
MRSAEAIRYRVSSKGGGSTVGVVCFGGCYPRDQEGSWHVERHFILVRITDIWTSGWIVIPAQPHVLLPLLLLPPSLPASSLLPQALLHQDFDMLSSFKHDAACRVVCEGQVHQPRWGRGGGRGRAKQLPLCAWIAMSAHPQSAADKLVGHVSAGQSAASDKQTGCV